LTQDGKTGTLQLTHPTAAMPERRIGMTQFPSFYDAKRIGTLFYPDMGAISAAAREADLKPAAADVQKNHLVVIDMQVDFCHKRGNLNVPGALEDIRRLIEFIYRHAEHITQITCSLDSHLPFQIFHPAWWADANGNHPAPFTLITYDDINKGVWRPLVDPVWSTNYVKTLEEQAKKVLTVWPYHVMIGSVGNALDQELWSAITWHALARKAQPSWLTKGTVPQTEHYSIIQPEVSVPGHPMGGKNKAFLDTLADADNIIIAGEAESHCVLETVEDLVEDFSQDTEALSKIFFLRDCTSPVLHPEIDFHAIAMERFAAFERMGVNFLDSTDALPFLKPSNGC
jgi:nicotinamidase-related amidase